MNPIYCVVFAGVKDQNTEPYFSVVAADSVFDAKEFAVNELFRINNLDVSTPVTVACLYESSSPEAADKMLNQIRNGTRDEARAR